MGLGAEPPRTQLSCVPLLSTPFHSGGTIRGSQGLNLCLREIENGGAGTSVWNGSALYHSSPENIDMFGLHEADETYRTALLPSSMFHQV